MKQCLIIARHQVTAAALNQFWALFEPANLEPASQPTVLIVEESDPIEIFDRLCTAIEEWMARLQPKPGSAVALVDQVGETEMDPLCGYKWSAAISMAILAFPELYWHFGNVNGKTNASVFDEHSLLTVLRVNRDPLMDYTGLRNLIRKQIRKESRIASYIPVREKLSVALDDEIPYAYLHAYAGYRNGFRSLPITREALALELFGQQPSLQLPSGLMLTFEDIYLSYPDQKDSTHYSDLAGNTDGSREAKLPGLKQIDFRIFVSSDHRHAGDVEKHQRNESYIDSKNCARQHSIKLGKPLAGLFDLWDRSRLKRKLYWLDGTGRTRFGSGEGFIWPPAKHEFISDDFGHSAPGRLLLIAEKLIERAHALLREGVRTMPEAIHGAVLVTDAIEFTGDRTPVTAIEALALKHQFELEAECRFSGVAYHIHIKPRINEIRREVAAVGNWFSPRNQFRSAQNAEMMVLGCMVEVLQSHNQFDEEQICANRMRHLHNSLWMNQKPARYLAWPAVRYIELLLGSFPRFMLVLVGWVFILAFLYSGFHHGGAWYTKWHFGFEEAVVSFFSAGTPMSGHDTTLHLQESEYVVVVCLAVILGFVHVGVFISHLYSSISRR